MVGKSRIAADYLLALGFLCSLGFVLPRLLPGDPLLAIYGEEALIHMTPEMKAELLRRLALDRSWIEQFAAYWVSLFRLDLGWSYYFNAPVLRIIGEFLPWSALLAGTALVLSNTVGFILGVESGGRRGSRLDKGLFAVLMLLGGMPDFLVGAFLLLLFAVIWPLFPLGGAVTTFGGPAGGWLDVVYHLALPLASLTLARLTMTYFLTRNTVVSLLDRPFVRTARAKGCWPSSIRYRHLGTMALLPTVTFAGLQLSHLFAGVLMVETVFGYPGMGGLFARALAARDYPLLQGILLVGTLLVLAINWAMDVLYPHLDPRMKTLCTSDTLGT